MIVYRLANARYSDRLQSSGTPNRWNLAGQQVIYTSQSISLCALELLAHTSGIRPSGTFRIMHIEIDNVGPPEEVLTEQLPDNWRQLSAYSLTQAIGDAWYERQKNLVLKIPSAVIPSEWNYMINSKHQDFEFKVRLLSIEDFFWDARFPSDM